MNVELWPLLILLPLAVFCALLMGPVLFGRLFMPRLTLGAFSRWGRWPAKLLDRIRPGLDLELLVRAGNRYFRRAFARTAFERRIMFLPFCLRPPHCPAGVSRDQGLLCSGDCPDCRLGEMRTRALELGYAAVYVVPSSRMLKGQGLMPSDQFILHKLKQHAPDGALGVVCGWHLRTRLIPRFKVGRGGFSTGSTKVVLQGLLLKSKNCRRAQVDWQRLEGIMRLQATPPAPAQAPAASSAAPAAPATGLGSSRAGEG